MQTIRTIMRGMGRTAILAYIIVVIITILSNREPTHQFYVFRYEKFRDLLFLSRIADLPPGRLVSE